MAGKINLGQFISATDITFNGGKKQESVSFNWFHCGYNHHKSPSFVYMLGQ